jgi:hypothetical protein
MLIIFTKEYINNLGETLNPTKNTVKERYVLYYPLTVLSLAAVVAYS